MVRYFLGFLCLCLVLLSTYASPLKNTSTLSFSEGFSRLYGEQNIVPYENGKSVSISMDARTSSGFCSQKNYMHGLFSASIKLPRGYTAGVVVTFYVSNNQKHPYNHDEIDFEFLGHIKGEKWIVQTNFYGNGSTGRGREERYFLGFDPSRQYHQYSILWTENQIAYYVDSVPIREVKRREAMGGDWPSKPMTLYATIWNGSDWATHGGQKKLDLNYSPFIANYSNFVLNGCPIDPTQLSSTCDKNSSFATILNGVTSYQTNKMKDFRRNYMTYSYCYDKSRYAVPLPECVMDSKEAASLRRLDPRTFGLARGRRK